MRILVVEDEEAIAAFLAEGLGKAGYAVDQASTGAEALYWTSIASYGAPLASRLDLVTVNRWLRRWTAVRHRRIEALCHRGRT